jgi:putative lipoic acid-binding regulatory protein
VIRGDAALSLSSSSSSNADEDSESAPPIPAPPKQGKKNDDDDVSERFKYKVNALMGVFDPADAETDTEYKNGNILNAILKFPLSYTFTVVGKKATTPAAPTDDDAHNDNNSNDEDDVFVAAVESVVLQESGVAHKKELSTTVTPRGTKFTKVVVKVTVESSDMIASIYNKLQQLEQVVMHY